MSVTNPFRKRGRGADSIADWATQAGKAFASGKSDYSNMPKRRKATVSGRGGARKRRAGGSRGAVSAFRLKATAGSRSRGRGLKRFGKRFGRKVGRKVGKLAFPKWFKALTAGIAPSEVLGEFGAQLSGNVLPQGNTTNRYINQCNVFTHWKHLGLWDITTAVDSIVGIAATGSGTSPLNNATRCYITNLTRRHLWKNAVQGGSQELQFYQLIPRRDMPIQNGSIAPVISPGVTGDYGTGGAQTNPTMWIQPFTDEGALVSSGGQYAGQKVRYNQNMVTPFMNPILTSNFKIKPLAVVGPNGKSSFQRLQPGQECSYEGKYRGPHMVSINKYDMMGNVNASVGALWEVRKGMPLIFVIQRGAVAHDSTTNTDVVTAPVSVDYYQTYKYEYWKPTPVGKNTIYVTTGVPIVPGGAPGAPVPAVVESVDIVNATDTVISAH